MFNHYLNHKRKFNIITRNTYFTHSFLIDHSTLGIVKLSILVFENTIRS